MIAIFRVISVLEGLSWLTLLLIAMPLKYMMNMPQFVPYVGMTHGVLFLLYLVFSLGAAQQQKWSLLFWLFTFVCAILPFGFILLEWQIKKKLPQAS